MRDEQKQTPQDVYGEAILNLDSQQLTQTQLKICQYSSSVQGMKRRGIRLGKIFKHHLLIFISGH